MESCTNLLKSDKVSGSHRLTPVQMHLQTFYFAFVGIFATTQLYRCLDRQKNKERSSKHPKGYWLNRFFPENSFPIRKDLVHLEANRVDILEKAVFRLSLPAEVMEELKFKDSPIFMFSKVTNGNRNWTIEVEGASDLNRLYYSIIAWINSQLKDNKLQVDTEYVVRLFYYYFGLECAPVPQPVFFFPKNGKKFRVKLAANTRKIRRPKIRFLQG